MGKEAVDIDVLQIIDRLESLVVEGTRIPMTGRAMVDEREFLDLIDQLRVSMPEELRQARRINQERERLLAEGRAEAERTMAAAQERVTFLLQDSELTKSAERRAEAILAEAQRRAEEMLEESRRAADGMLVDAKQQAEQVRAGADAYAREVLGTLEQELNRHCVMVRKGLAMLDKSNGDQDGR